MTFDIEILLMSERILFHVKVTRQLELMEYIWN